MQKMAIHEKIAACREIIRAFGWIYGGGVVNSPLLEIGRTYQDDEQI